MTKEDKAQKKIRKKITKNDLPVLDSDHDFLSVFMGNPIPGPQGGKQGQEDKIQSGTGQTIPRLNKHGLPVIEDLETELFLDQTEFRSEPGPEKFIDSGETEESKDSEENFKILLEKSLKQKAGFVKKKPLPMPVKKRLRRYPLPEKELDLHGFTAVGAEIKAKSFILACKHQGFFTLSIIVGKGLHSDTGPVLPDVIEDLLKALKKENIVLAYEWDRKKKSKSGVLIVYIKQFNQFSD
jgi:DNA-nicking Smr family endonuclease